MPKSALADRRRLGEHPEPPEPARHRDQLVAILGDELAREAVQPRDPTLLVVAGQARVGSAFVARDAVPAAASDGRADEIALREASPVALDDPEQLVAEDEQAAARRRRSE